MVELSVQPTADYITGGGDVTVNPTSLTFTSVWDTAQTVTRRPRTTRRHPDGGPRRGQQQRRRVRRGHPRRARDGDESLGITLGR